MAPRGWYPTNNYIRCGQSIYMQGGYPCPPNKRWHPGVGTRQIITFGMDNPYTCRVGTLAHPGKKGTQGWVPYQYLNNRKFWIILQASRDIRHACQPQSHYSLIPQSVLPSGAALVRKIGFRPTGKEPRFPCGYGG